MSSRRSGAVGRHLSRFQEGSPSCWILVPSGAAFCPACFAVRGGSTMGSGSGCVFGAFTSTARHRRFFSNQAPPQGTRSRHHVSAVLVAIAVTQHRKH